MLRLTRYLALGVLSRTAASLLLLTTVYAAIDIIEVSSRAGTPSDGAYLWYLLKLPSITGQLLPLALVLGVQLSLSALRKRGEWEAILSAGRLRYAAREARVAATPMRMEGLR